MNSNWLTPDQPIKSQRGKKFDERLEKTSDLAFSSVSYSLMFPFLEHLTLYEFQFKKTNLISNYLFFLIRLKLQIVERMSNNLTTFIKRDVSPHSRPTFWIILTWQLDAELELAF